MKRKGTNLALWVMFSSMIALIVAIVVLNLIFQEKDDWMQLLYSLMGDLLSAIIIGLFLGLVTKIITNKLFSVEINMKKMRDFGIQGIGTGRSNKADVHRMFGSENNREKYPSEIKLLFLTGNTFLKTFKEKMVKCLDNGCKISLLITSPEEENLGYLKRSSFRFTDGDKDYVEEVIRDSLVSVQYIKSKTKNPDNFKIRFYLDEYQNNIRISRYFLNNEKEKTYYWINVQPISKPAIDLSIALKGKHETDYTLDGNKGDETDICYVSEKGFDKLWTKYESSEYIYDKAMLILSNDKSHD